MWRKSGSWRGGRRLPALASLALTLLLASSASLLLAARIEAKDELGRGLEALVPADKKAHLPLKAHRTPNKGACTHVNTHQVEYSPGLQKMSKLPRSGTAPTKSPRINHKV